MKTANIKLISLDLYRTLIDVDQSLPLVWKTFLQAEYTPELGQKYWDRASEIVLAKLYDPALNSQPFKNVRRLYEETYSELFQEIAFDYDPAEAATVLIEGHRVNNLFADVRPFLKSAGQKYRVCISTDADCDMLPDIEGLYTFDKVFISEELQAYKQNPEFFKQVLEYYQLKPEQILHIGDSQADILTPQKMGLHTCWLNRNHNRWPHEIKPDFEVNSLLEVIPILK